MPDGRQALLAAGTAAFAADGYDGADLRGIAQAAQVDPALVRIHFGAKAGLWKACLDGIVAQAAPMMAVGRALAGDESRPVRDRLRELIERYVAFSLDHPEVRQFASRHAIETPERAALLTERLVRPGYEAALPLFVAAMAQGILRVPHPALFFLLLNNALHQPTAAPALLRNLMPDIDDNQAKMLLGQSIVTIFLHDPFPAAAD
jgi:AcrR family transcriptional regulator